MKITTDLMGLLAERSRRSAARKPKPAGERESDVQGRIREWLTRVEGWRCVATDRPGSRGAGIVEKGIADDLYIRYDADAYPDKENLTGHARAGALVMWVEFKLKTGYASNEQILWHIAERSRGALTCIFGHDCEATEESFKQWYGKEGLSK